MATQDSQLKARQWLWGFVPWKRHATNGTLAALLVFFANLPILFPSKNHLIISYHTHIVAREQVPEKGSSRLRASVAKQTSTHQAAMAWWRCWIFSVSKKLIDLNMQNHPIISSYLNRLTVLFALFVFICFWHLSWLGKALQTEGSASVTQDIGRLQQFLYFGSITSSEAWLRGTSLPLAWVYLFEIFGSNTSQTTGWRDNMSK